MTALITNTAGRLRESWMRDDMALTVSVNIYAAGYKHPSENDPLPNTDHVVGNNTGE